MINPDAVRAVMHERLQRSSKKPTAKEIQEFKRKEREQLERERKEGKTKPSWKQNVPGGTGSPDYPGKKYLA